MKKQIRYWMIAVCVVLVVGSLLLDSYLQKNSGLYTVVFQDYDGTVLDSQTVKANAAATAPDVPEKDGFFFVGWDRDYKCITEDITVTAQYVQATSPTIAVVGKTAAPGQTIKIPVVIVKNPGVAGAKITIVYDPALILSASESGEAFSGLDYTKPGKYMSPCNFTWDSENGMSKNEGYILWLTFIIPEDAAVGKTYTVNCVYREGDIYNENLRDVYFQTINGVITVG